MGDAERDLDAWEDDFPSEAILQRAHILRERASLAETIGKDVSRAASYIEEAIGLLEGSLQVMVALECRWRLARLTVYENRELSKSQLANLEGKLASLNKQPSLGHPYFEMALCYALLGMGEECMRAYEKAVGFETP